MSLLSLISRVQFGLVRQLFFCYSAFPSLFSLYKEQSIVNLSINSIYKFDIILFSLSLSFHSTIDVSSKLVWNSTGGCACWGDFCEFLIVWVVCDRLLAFLFSNIILWSCNDWGEFCVHLLFILIKILLLFKKKISQ